VADRADGTGDDAVTVVPLTGAVHQRGQGVAGSGIDPGTGEWTPAFPAQREPFRPGHEVSVSHGAYSEPRLLELAAQFETELMASAHTPGYIRGGQFARIVTAWARAEARVELLTRYLDEMGIRAAMDERTRGTEDEVNTRPGGTKKKIRLRRTPPPLDALERAEGTAARLRGRLGLDPASYAQLAKDVSLANRAGEHDPIEKLAADGREIRARREAADAAAREYRDRSGLPGRPLTADPSRTP
jgi:hypothetical protein